MSDNSSSSKSGGIGLFGAMFLIMFTLKLAGPMAGVSWWIVTAPLWGGFLFFMVVFFIAVIIALVKKRRQKKLHDTIIAYARATDPNRRFR